MSIRRYVPQTSVLTGTRGTVVCTNVNRWTPDPDSEFESKEMVAFCEEVTDLLMKYTYGDFANREDSDPAQLFRAAQFVIATVSANLCDMVQAHLPEDHGFTIDSERMGDLDIAKYKGEKYVDEFDQLTSMCSPPAFCDTDRYKV